MERVLQMPVGWVRFPVRNPHRKLQKRYLRSVQSRDRWWMRAKKRFTRGVATGLPPVQHSLPKWLPGPRRRLSGGRCPQTRVLRGESERARVAGTRIRGARAGWLTRCRAGWEILCAGNWVLSQGIWINRLKNRKTLRCTEVASNALRTVGLQQLLHYDVTTHCCETLAQTLAMWWVSDSFPMLPSYLGRNNLVWQPSSKCIRQRLTAIQNWLKRVFYHLTSVDCERLYLWKSFGLVANENNNPLDFVVC